MALQLSEIPSTTVISELVEMLGEPLVAVIAGIDSAATVSCWAVGKQMPDAEIQKTLDNTLKVVLILHGECKLSPQMIRAWFMGMNPFLDDASPAETISTDPEAVIGAANGELTGSYG